MHTQTALPQAYTAFSDSLAAGGRDALRRGVIGKDIEIDGPFGPKKMLYADYVASGRALSQVESFVMEQVLPYYANTHTEASYTGSKTTQLREGARHIIARACDAGDDCSVVFAGSGATAGLNRLVTLCGVRKALAEGRAVRILHGPYEHHSNILPWRESGAEVIEIPESATGGPDLAVLEDLLAAAPRHALVIGAFSAASNVSGIITDVVAVTRLLKQHGAVAIWDYAGGGPYLPISMEPAPGVQIDAILISAHKFLGGPGASGIMIMRKSVCACKTPSWPGGGTVSYVSSKTALYSDRIEDREEAGTPNIIGDIRAGLAFLVKQAIGIDWMQNRQTAMARLGIAALSSHPQIDLLGATAPRRLPIFSMQFRTTDGAPVHYQLATRLLSDKYGIQARGGCACAGPYGHRLLDLHEADEARLMRAAQTGQGAEMPGFVRFNISPLMTDEEASYLLAAAAAIPADAQSESHRYACQPHSGLYLPRVNEPPRDRPSALHRLRRWLTGNGAQTA